MYKYLIRISRTLDLRLPLYLNERRIRPSSGRRQICNILWSSHNFIQRCNTFNSEYEIRYFQIQPMQGEFVYTGIYIKVWVWVHTSNLSFLCEARYDGKQSFQPSRLWWSVWYNQYSLYVFTYAVIIIKVVKKKQNNILIFT